MGLGANARDGVGLLFDQFFSAVSFPLCVLEGMGKLRTNWEGEGEG